MTDMTIAKLARAANVGVETVRYYQRRGLMPVPRVAGKTAYRHYDAGHLQMLLFIRRAQAAGFTLEEIKELLSLDRTRDRGRIRVLAGQRLEALARQAEELETSRQALQRLLGVCQGSAPAAICNLSVRFGSQADIEGLARLRPTT
jgi:MerR family mercuric resistance operon transcriptional regulator